ncbi:MAG: transcription termination/antitermination protein NusA [Deltaproteobacteria bacterium]|nr:transcription termination/antitermination protein NusA [Deltaproteobacteria bacterium]
MVSDLAKTITQVSREKGVDPNILTGALEDAVRAAARKKFGPNYDLEVRFNEEIGEIEVFEFKEVVEKIENENFEISLDEALKLDPECEVGDSLGVKMDPVAFGRIAAQSAKQVIMQRFKEAERNVIFDSFKDRRGEIVNGIVQRFERGSIIVNLGRTEAELPAREQVSGESYTQGDRIRVYIIDVKQHGRGPQIILSRKHPNFVSALFENEVPEISEGIVKIMYVAREAGSRTKVAVSSTDPDVDPVGACVGMKGRRVQAVVQELRGERIDIVPWDPDPAKFICNALLPADITRLVINEEDNSVEVVVSDDQLSLAIGKRGQNVRLASKLTGWRLNVTSEAKYNKSLENDYDALLGIEGLDPELALRLCNMGFKSPADVARANIGDILAVEGMTEDKCALLIENALRCISAEKAGDNEIKQQVFSERGEFEEINKDSEDNNSDDGLSD